MEIIIEDDPSLPMRLGGVWDYRDDPEGMFYGKEPDTLDDRIKKSELILQERLSKLPFRQRSKNGPVNENGVQIL